jgi:hypothetical protein
MWQERRLVCCQGIVVQFSYEDCEKRCSPMSILSSPRVEIRHLQIAPKFFSVSLHRNHVIQPFIHVF